MFEEKQPLLPGCGSVPEIVCLPEGRLAQGTTSSWGAVFIIINAALGAGLLAFPVAFYLAGGTKPALLVMLVSHVNIQLL